MTATLTPQVEVGEEAENSWKDNWERQKSPWSLSSELERPIEKVKSNAKNLKVTSMFIKIADGGLGNDDHEGTLNVGPRLERVLSLMSTDVCLGLVVVLDIYLTALSIDYRAAGETTPVWLNSIGNACLAVYTVEFLAWVIVKRWRVVLDKWLMLDLGFLVSGYAEVVVALSGGNIESMGMLRILRIVRIMRLVKIFRKFIMLKELRKLLMMAASCLKTLLWSFLFCFVVMTSFAMASVELINPIVQDLSEQGMFEGCVYCPRSMDSVMSANLYLFKTVIAGDSWGQVAMPIIYAAPETSIIFIGSLLVIVFGVLNLIVAVVVDTFAEQRQKDVASLAEEMEHEEEIDLGMLTKIFQKIDEDESGELTLDELMQGARRVPEFQSRLRVMDIDEQDLEQLFSMLDSDGGGTIDPDEFKGALSRWIHESKTATRFVKYNVQKVMHEQEAIRIIVGDTNKKIAAIKAQMDKVPKMSPRGGVYIPGSGEPDSENLSPEAGSESLMNDMGLKDLKDTELKEALQKAAQDLKAADLVHELSSLQAIEESLRKSLAEAMLLCGDLNLDDTMPDARRTTPGRELDLTLPKSTRKIHLAPGKWKELNKQNGEQEPHARSSGRSSNSSASGGSSSGGDRSPGSRQQSKSSTLQMLREGFPSDSVLAQSSSALPPLIAVRV